MLPNLVLACFLGNWSFGIKILSALFFINCISSSVDSNGFKAFFCSFSASEAFLLTNKSTPPSSIPFCFFKGLSENKLK